MKIFLLLVILFFIEAFGSFICFSFNFNFLGFFLLIACLESLLPAFAIEASRTMLLMAPLLAQ